MCVERNNKKKKKIKTNRRHLRSPAIGRAIERSLSVCARAGYVYLARAFVTPTSPPSSLPGLCPCVAAAAPLMPPAAETPSPNVSGSQDGQSSSKVASCAGSGSPPPRNKPSGVDFSAAWGGTEDRPDVIFYFCLQLNLTLYLVSRFPGFLLSTRHSMFRREGRF
jgi:hypothetical protein